MVGMNTTYPVWTSHCIGVSSGNTGGAMRNGIVKASVTSSSGTFLSLGNGAEVELRMLVLVTLYYLRCLVAAIVIYD